MVGVYWDCECDDNVVEKWEYSGTVLRQSWDGTGTELSTVKNGTETEIETCFLLKDF